VLTVSTVKGRRMPIVRRSQSSSSTMVGLGKWGNEGKYRQEGAQGYMTSWFGKVFKRGGGVKYQSAQVITLAIFFLYRFFWSFLPLLKTSPSKRFREEI